MLLVRANITWIVFRYRSHLLWLCRKLLLSLVHRIAGAAVTHSDFAAYILRKTGRIVVVNIDWSTICACRANGVAEMLYLLECQMGRRKYISLENFATLVDSANSTRVALLERLTYGSMSGKGPNYASRPLYQNPEPLSLCHFFKPTFR